MVSVNTMVLDIGTDPETARILRKASAKDRSKLVFLWSVLVREYEESPATLRKLMDEIGSKARKHGLTAGTLESILDAK